MSRLAEMYSKHPTKLPAVGPYFNGLRQLCGAFRSPSVAVRPWDQPSLRAFIGGHSTFRSLSASPISRTSPSPGPADFFLLGPHYKGLEQTLDTHFAVPDFCTTSSNINVVDSPAARPAEPLQTAR